MLPRGFLLALLCTSVVAADFQPLPQFTKPITGLHILAQCVPRQPWTVAGEQGALFGRQNGKFEAWQWPVKLFSNFSLRAELADYAVPIDVNALAAEIKVSPAETVITYSHSAFTIRQHMFAARGPEQSVASAAVVFEFESARSMEVTFSFTPEMLKMWPASNSGRPNGEWVKDGAAGAYVLHTDDPKFSGVVGMPGSRPGIMVPYQEHPQTYPLELKLTFDPKRDAGKEFPLVMGVATGEPALAQVSKMSTGLPAVYEKAVEYYRQFLLHHLRVETPNHRLNEAAQWAEVAIDQAQVRYHGETGMVAGYYESADSARPGYAWFFGRDTLWSTYAINSYGDFGLTRRALDFILKRQREDGKIMHEFSQSAEALDWKSTPYFYAAADAAPLLVMAMADYVKSSGDIDYLRANWNAVKKAYQFTRAHESADGIYNNSQGTGWVESWPDAMPHQEVYLAAVDVQSALALNAMAKLMKDGALETASAAKAAAIRQKIESEYYESSGKFYAFSINQAATKDNTASIYPAVAWWDGTYALQSAGPMLSRWAGSEFSTDWGTRDISNKTSFYDPISYHQGSIWPLFTGWVALAEYRAGRSLSGYSHLMQNANLTWAQDLGSVTELLSGDYYQPLGRSSSHQLWSSAMVLSPLLRGLFGLEWDAPNRTLKVTPHLPADWTEAKLHNVSLGYTLLDLDMHRRGNALVVEGRSQGGATFCLATQGSRSGACKPGTTQALNLKLRPVELAITIAMPEQGSTTSQLKVLDESYGDRRATFTLEGLAGRTYDVPVKTSIMKLRAKGAALSNGALHLKFPNGSGYEKQTVVLSW